MVETKFIHIQQNIYIIILCHYKHSIPAAICLRCVGNFYEQFIGNSFLFHVEKVLKIWLGLKFDKVTLCCLYILIHYKGIHSKWQCRDSKRDLMTHAQQDWQRNTIIIKHSRTYYKLSAYPICNIFKVRYLWHKCLMLFTRGFKI